MSEASESATDSGSEEGSVRVIRSTGVQTRPSPSTIAWAYDADTGALISIHELSADRRGLKCRCVCPGCEGTLVAVNAATAQWKVRPHFRHHAGTDRASCVVATSEHAVLAAILHSSDISLPTRDVVASTRGLSGALYEAGVSEPAETARICQFERLDRVSAVLTLDDGRKLHVYVSAIPSAVRVDGSVAAAIVVECGEDVALMSPEELRVRLSIPNQKHSVWIKHWQDDGLRRQAESAANAIAVRACDAAPSGVLLDGTAPPNDQRAALVYAWVVNLIETSDHLVVPAGRFLRKPERLTVAAVEVKARQLNGMRADLELMVRRADGREGCLLLEISTARNVDEGRRLKFAEVGKPAIEVDLVKAAGYATQDKLSKIVLEEIYNKWWIVDWPKA